MTLWWVLVGAAGLALIVWGAESFAEHLAAASVRLGVSTFALALLLVGAEPEELATSVSASLGDVPAIALGDAIGANVTMVLVALGVAALVAPVPYDRRVRRYTIAGLVTGAVAVALAWDGTVSRPEGLVMVTAYVAFVAIIWRVERGAPPLGEAVELFETDDDDDDDGDDDNRPVATGGGDGRSVWRMLAGLGGLVVGAGLFVEAVRRAVDAEAAQSRLGLTAVGFATGFELVVLAWSSARRGITSAVMAGIVGSFTYNATMTLGAGALVRPLVVADATLVRAPGVAMVAALAAGPLLAGPGRRITRAGGAVLLALYGSFLALVLLA